MPVVLGRGKKLFADGSAPHAYELLGSRVSSTGVVIGHYRRAGAVETVDGAEGEPSRAEVARQARMAREG